MQQLNFRGAALAAAIALSVCGSAQVARAVDSTWGGSGSTNTNDFTLNTNWFGDTLPVGGWAYIENGGDHNPVMDSAFDTNVLTTSSGANSLTSSFTLTGAGTMTMTGDSSSSFVANAANFDFTVDIASLVITGRGTYLVSGDYTTVSADAGVGSLVLGHAGGPMTMTYTYGGTSTNRPQIVAHNAGPLADTGTSIIVYPKLDFSAAKGSSSSYIQLRPDSLSTIQLLGGITGGPTPHSGNPTKLVRTNGQVGGKTILGDSSGWLGIMRIETSDLEINSDNSLGATDGYTEIQPGANTGALRLTNGITTPETIYIYGRDTTDFPQIRNISGSNTLAGDVTTDSTISGYAMINSDGTATGDLLTIQGNILRTGDGSGELILQGAGKGVVAGNITQTGSGVWNSVTKTGGGKWTLSGTNDYAGTTNVNGGTLLVNGSHTGGAGYSVNAGGTLGGTGSINAPIVVNADGYLAPGASIGTLTLDGNSAASPLLTLASGGTLSYELDNSFSSDILALVNGEANDIGFNNNVIDFTDLATGSLATGDYTLFTSNVAGAYSGLTLGGGNVITAGLTIGSGLGAYSSALLRLSGNDIVLSLESVPEPSACGLVLCAALGVLSGWRLRAVPDRSAGDRRARGRCCRLR